MAKVKFRLSSYVVLLLEDFLPSHDIGTVKDFLVLALTYVILLRLHLRQLSLFQLLFYHIAHLFLVNLGLVRLDLFFYYYLAVALQTTIFPLGIV